MKYTSIEDVLSALDAIIMDCKKRQDPSGYFAVIYRMVTQRVRDGIAQNQFEDNARMERLDVLFASRYLDAYEAYREQKPCSKSWIVAFETAHENHSIILQHILLGINAHINLDLGIAALDTMKGESLEPIRNDFNSINQVLQELVDRVKNEMSAVSPLFKWLIPLAPKTEEMMINFSIQTAREGAWMFAEELYSNQRNEIAIKNRDELIATLGLQIKHPGRLLSLINRLIAWTEWRSVAKNLSIMEK